ncbi:MAG: hypothetical protein LBR15_07330 [Methanobrevibacter sp.]|jgi:hypothetical protein|nr:hypothetical protein [Candidatus Methanovirga australis]
MKKFLKKVVGLFIICILMSTIGGNLATDDGDNFNTVKIFNKNMNKAVKITYVNEASEEVTVELNAKGNATFNAQLNSLINTSDKQTFNVGDKKYEPLSFEIESPIDVSLYNDNVYPVTVEYMDYNTHNKANLTLNEKDLYPENFIPSVLVEQNTQINVYYKDSTLKLYTYNTGNNPTKEMQIKIATANADENGNINCYGDMSGSYYNMNCGNMINSSYNVGSRDCVNTNHSSNSYELINAVNSKDCSESINIRSCNRVSYSSNMENITVNKYHRVEDSNNCSNSIDITNCTNVKNSNNVKNSSNIYKCSNVFTMHDKANENRDKKGYLHVLDSGSGIGVIRISVDESGESGARDLVRGKEELCKRSNGDLKRVEDEIQRDLDRLNIAGKIIGPTLIFLVAVVELITESIAIAGGVGAAGGQNQVVVIAGVSIPKSLLVKTAIVVALGILDAIITTVGDAVMEQELSQCTKEMEWREDPNHKYIIEW